MNTRLLAKTILFCGLLTIGRYQPNPTPVPTGTELFSGALQHVSPVLAASSR